MSAIAWLGFAVTVAGAGFFVAGTAGLIRFPDPLSRLHALAKADNVGLGCTVVGLAIQAASPSVTLKLLLTWTLTLTAGAACTYLIAGSVARRERAGDG